MSLLDSIMMWMSLADSNGCRFQTQLDVTGCHWNPLSLSDSNGCHWMSLSDFIGSCHWMSLLTRTVVVARDSELFFLEAGIQVETDGVWHKLTAS